MVENTNVGEHNNVYYLEKVIKAIVVSSDFLFKLKVHQWWKTVMLKKTIKADFRRIVIKKFVVINSYIGDIIKI